MKTLLFTTEYPPFKGGVASYYKNLAAYWPAKEEIQVLDNANNQLLKGKFWPKWLPAVFLLIKYLKKNKTDNIIIGQLLPLGIVVYIVSFFYEFSYAIIIHGMELSFAQRKIRKKIISRLILKRAKQIICVGNYTSGLAKEFMGAEFYNNIQVVNPGVEPLPSVDAALLEKIKSENELADKIVLFTVARLVKRKGHDMAIAAMKELVKIEPQINYFIAGAGPDEDYLQEAARGMDNIHFLGKISDEEKWAWLLASDIFIMPSRNIDGDFEGFGIVYLEAAIAGKPAIAGDSGGTKDAVVNGETGFVVNPNDINEIAQAVLKLAQNEMLRKKFGAAARERALKDFSWNKQAALIRDMLN